MALDPRIILAGAQPNLMAAFDQGQQAGERGNQIGTQNALRSLYQTQGAGIASGDQGALNALAAIDPMASLGVQGQRQQMQARTQQMEMLTREEARQVQDRAASLSQAERAAQAQQIEQSVAMGLSATTPEQWDAMMQQTAPELVGQFDQRQMLANRFMSIADILKRQDEAGAGQQYRPATPEEAQQYGAQSGQVNTKTGQFTAINPPRGMSIEVGPDGRTRIIEGPGAGAQNGDVNVGDAYNPGEVMSTIALIDEIMEDPALPRVVGPLIGGGGNDVDQLNMVQRGVYGAEGLNVIEKVNQLQSRTWLAARDMLKGGGPITDYESRKAEAAVARLSRAKGDEEYMAALQDLRDAITEGMAKLQSRGNPQATTTQPAPQANTGAGDVRPRLGTVQDGYRYLGGNPANPASWEQVQ